MKQKGFTLIELLVVISVIGLLASVLLVALNSTRSKARDTKRLADMHQLQSALDFYFGDNGVYPTCGGNDICDSISSNTPAWGVWSTFQTVPTYMAAMPIDPTNTNQYKYCYARKYKRTGSNTFTYTGLNTDYIIGMELENANNPAAVPSWAGCNTTFNYLIGN